MATVVEKADLRRGFGKMSAGDNNVAESQTPRNILDINRLREAPLQTGQLFYTATKVPSRSPRNINLARN
jgi:hypothetical protein